MLPAQSTGVVPIANPSAAMAKDMGAITGYTFEVGARSGERSGFFPPYSCQEGTHRPKIRLALMYAAARAAAPCRAL